MNTPGLILQQRRQQSHLGRFGLHSVGLVGDRGRKGRNSATSRSGEGSEGVDRKRGCEGGVMDREMMLRKIVYTN